MYQHECFLKNGQGSPVIKTSSLERFRGYPIRESHAPVDNFTPLSLRLANVSDGHAQVIESENKLRLYNPITLTGIQPLKNLRIGYIALPRIGAGFQGYQLVAFLNGEVKDADEIPLGVVSKGNSNNLEFRFGNNTPAYIYENSESSPTPIVNLVPIGKVLISRARHATELQNELRQRLSLALRQRRNLEASSELPEENSFLHAGEYLENSKGQYSNLLVISGHLKK